MHIQFTHLAAVPGQLDCGWCGAVVTDPSRHAQWHYRNESRGVGDASASGATYSVEQPLIIDVSGPLFVGEDFPMGDLTARHDAYGAVLSEGEAIAMGLLPDPADDVGAHTWEENLRLIDGSYAFAVPVHSVPVTGSYSAPPPYSTAVGDWLRDLREVARARAAVKHGTGTTLDHVREELTAMVPEVEQQFADLRERRGPLRRVHRPATREQEQAYMEQRAPRPLGAQDAAVAEAMREQGASCAQIVREMELRREQRPE